MTTTPIPLKKDAVSEKLRMSPAWTAMTLLKQFTKQFNFLLLALFSDSPTAFCHYALAGCDRPPL